LEASPFQSYDEAAQKYGSTGSSTLFEEENKLAWDEFIKLQQQKRDTNVNGIQKKIHFIIITFLNTIYI